MERIKERRVRKWKEKISKKMKIKKISIDLGFAELVAEVNADPNVREIIVSLEKNGIWLQDLAIVRQKEDFKIETYEKKIEVLLYEDETTEDYTAKKEINICEE